MLTQSPSQTVGPFFHYGLIHGRENVLVDEQTAGERIVLTGQVLDGDGAPVPDAMVEIWQADAQGIYPHQADARHAEADQHFRSFGRSRTDKDGVFEFYTVKPGITTDEQVPHVNVRVFARGMLIHAVTRFYFGDVDNGDDPILALVDEDRRPTLITAKDESGGMVAYRQNIKLQGDSETVFFNP